MDVLIASLVLLFLFCAISSMPTQSWYAAASWLQARRIRRLQRALERDLFRRTRQRPFRADITFIPRGIGLAFDRSHRLFYVATRQGRQVTGAVLSLDQLIGQKVGDAYNYGFEDHYVDVAVTVPTSPTWRLWCGEDASLANDISTSIARIRNEIGNVEDESDRKAAAQNAASNLDSGSS